MTKDEAIEKVRALLALASSNNEHEAANAAARAAAIMERHRIDAAMLIEAEHEADVEAEAFSMNRDILADRDHDRLPAWYWGLAWGIATANSTRPRRGTGRVYFVGRPSDAAASVYMLNAIANDVDRLAAAYVAAHPGRRSRAIGKAFRLGCSRTIAVRLGKVRRETADTIRGELVAAQDTAALVRLDSALARQVADAAALDAFLESGGVKYSKARKLSVSSPESYRAGAEAGKTVRLAGGAASLGAGARALPPGRGSR